MTSPPPPSQPGLSPSLAEKMQTAVSLHRAGSLVEAEGVYREVLAGHPDFPDALHHLGMVRAQRGDPEEGLALVRRAIGLDPRNLVFRFNLISLLKEHGAPEAVDTAYSETAAAAGAHGAAFCRQAEALAARGRLVEARHFFRMAAVAEPGNPLIWSGIGKLDLARRRFAEAGESAARALEISPGNVEALTLRGSVLAAQGKAEEAARVFAEVLEVEPGALEANLNLGDLHLAAGRGALAAAAYQKGFAAAREPLPAQAYVNLAAALAHAGRLGEAETALRDGLRFHAQAAPIHAALCAVLKRAGKMTEAEAAGQFAARIDPDNAEAPAALGELYFEQRRFGEAAQALGRAIELNPHRAPPHFMLGNVLGRQCRFGEAIAAYREALRLNPLDRVAQSNLLLTLNYRQPESLQALFEEHVRVGASLEAGVAPAAAHRNAPQPERPLRVGFVSPNFRAHPVAIFIHALLAHHHAAEYHFTAYSGGVGGDAFTGDMRGRVEEWRDTAGLSEPELAAEVRADGIDILVDLTGHMGDNRLGVFAHKPAPVQVSYMGYLNTTGMRRMDYWVTDGWQNPPDTDRYFTETLYRLPRCFVCYTPLGESPPVAPAPCRQNGFVTFGCFNNGTKVGPAVVETWAALLKAVPGSRLLFKGVQFGDPPTVQLFRHRFREQGIEPECLDFAPPSRRVHYLAEFSRIDIGLDPFPYNGNTSTNDALWMGVPVVTLAGDNAISRTGLSLLTALGHPEWVAETREDYVEIAKGLAGDVETLARTRAGLRSAMEASPLCDGPGLAQAMEDAFRDMWRRWCETQPVPD